MNRLAEIRLHIFGITQQEMADIAGTTQATVSRWESEGLEPSLTQMQRIRDEAIRRALPWDDRRFFERLIHPAGRVA